MHLKLCIYSYRGAGRKIFLFFFNACEFTHKKHNSMLLQFICKSHPFDLSLKESNSCFTEYYLNLSMVSKFSIFGQQRETLLFPAAVTFCFQILWKEYFTKPTIFPEMYKLINVSSPSKPFSISQMSVLGISLLLMHLDFIRLPDLDVPAQLSQELVMSFLLGRPGRGW